MAITVKAKSREYHQQTIAGLRSELSALHREERGIEANIQKVAAADLL